MQGHERNLKTSTYLFFLYFLTVFISFSPLNSARSAENEPLKHGISMHGSLKYKANFPHYDYVNPNAVKGGTLNLGLQGTFTSLNPLNIRGGSAAGIRGYVYESLLSRALDEPFSLYGLIAEKVEMPDNRSSITFHLNPKAHFSDGKQITVKDVIFSLKLLREHGRPNHRTYYAKVKAIETPAPNAVKFIFDDGTDREIPLIMGLMPILPAHAMTVEAFKATSFNAPIGSGPYKVAKLDPGKQITYERDPNYWGTTLNVNVGQYNFAKIIYTYYRDSNTLFEAFKKGLHDVHYEANPGKWKTSYDFSAIKDGRILKKEFSLKIPAGMQALVFNTRRAKFADPRIRKALNYMFNFEDLNRKLFHDLYTRTESYFDRSILASKGHPADETEAEILGPKFTKTYPEIYQGAYRLPHNKSNSLDRTNIRKALKLFKAAGYELKNGAMINKISGTPMTFEIMTISKSQEGLLLNYIEKLKLIGITVNLRQVDATQYQKRKANFDFDMFENTWSGTLSPGNEQLFRWGSKQADTEGSFNFAGVKDPLVDKAITALLAAKSPEIFVSSVRALDRALLSGDYVIPLYHLKTQWLAHWAYLGHPETVSNYGAILESWWDKRAETGQ